MSYRNIIYNGRDSSVRLFTWDENGKRISYETSYEPYLFVEGNGKYESIFGTKLIKKKFQNQYGRYKFIKDTGIKRVFENLQPHQQYLVDRYWEENEDEDFNKHPIKTMFIDIENLFT